jgi:maleate cis-trans isomerase
MSTPTIGLLYPGFAAEDDFPALEATLDGRVRLPLVHTSVGEDAHRVDALLDLGAGHRLVAGAEELARHRPDSVMWACTSGSFVFGWDGAKRQVDEIAQAVGLPVSSTSLAFVRAAHAMALRTVAIVASYPDDVARHFVEFLRSGGLEVTTMSSHDILTAAEVGLLGRDDVVTMVREAPTDGADVLLVPDTAMHTLQWVDDLEEAAGRPVLTANQVTVWEGLALLEEPVPQLPGLGSLFRTSS